MLSYARSKLANIMFARELAKRVSGNGVTVCSLHPGVVDTGLTRDMYSGWFCYLKLLKVREYMEYIEVSNLIHSSPPRVLLPCATHAHRGKHIFFISTYMCACVCVYVSERILLFTLLGSISRHKIHLGNVFVELNWSL